MKFYDLTRGEFFLFKNLNDSDYVKQIDFMSGASLGFQKRNLQSIIDVSKLLNNIPVFLVKSSMAGEYVSVPGCQCIIYVPEDMSMEEEGIWDKLGLYVYSNENDVIPRRIFIWIDKFWDYTGLFTDIEIIDDAIVWSLFELTLYHEMAHALMDVELYGVHPAPNFSYAKDYPYRYIEEAFANFIALETLYDSYRSYHYPLDDEQKAQFAFIELFVKSQGPGYSDDWKLYQKGSDITFWMEIKVKYDKQLASLIQEFMKTKDFRLIGG